MTKINFSKPIKSPLDEYKGTITFPYPFTAPTYRLWSESHKTYLEAESKGTVRSGSYHTNGDGPRLDEFDPAKWGTILDLCTVKVKGLPDGWDKDKSGETIPFSVLAWAIGALDIYEADNLNLKAIT